MDIVSDCIGRIGSLFSAAQAFNVKYCIFVDKVI